MSHEANRREFTRVIVHIKAEVSSKKTATITGTVRNVSMNGIFVECQAPMAVGIPCLIILPLSSDQKTSRIEIGGKIVRTDPDGVAIAFTDILGLESYEHLRNLVLLNAGRVSEHIEEAFRARVGLTRSPGTAGQDPSSA